MGVPTISAPYPLQCGGCVLWLDGADPLNTGVVPADATAISTWSDKSGRGNNLTQGTGANQPLLKRNIQGGLSVVRFDGSNDSIAQATNTDFQLNKDMTFYSVACSTATPGTFQRMYSRGNFPPGGYGYGRTASTSEGDFTMFATQSNVTSSSGAFYASNGVFEADACVFTNSGSTIQIYKNNTSYLSQAAGALTANNVAFTVGIQSDLVQPWKGDIAELIIFANKHTTTQVQDMFRWLGNKWGMAIA